MSSWIVARRTPEGRWQINPRVMDETEARDYARRLPENLKIVGLNLDSLPALPAFEETAK